MRRPSMAQRTTRSVVPDRERLASQPPARERYLTRPSAFGARTASPLAGLVEALAPLGMPHVRHDPPRPHGSWVSRICAAMYLPSSWAACSSVINGAAVVVIHLAALRYVFLPIGTV
jgi:hypothetical protein